MPKGVSGVSGMPSKVNIDFLVGATTLTGNNIAFVNVSDVEVGVGTVSDITSAAYGALNSI